MGRLFHNLTTLLLAAAVLAGSLLSPGVRHAHSEGVVPHSHVAEAAAHDVGDEHHGHASGGRHHHDSDVPAKEVLADHTTHLHISLLGFDFTFPQEGEPNGPLTPDDERLLAVFRVTPEIVTNSTVALDDLVDLSAATAALTDRRDAKISPAKDSLIRPVDRILLCDSARCERSGVLLI